MADDEVAAYQRSAATGHRRDSFAPAMFSNAMYTMEAAIIERQTGERPSFPPEGQQGDWPIVLLEVRRMSISPKREREVESGM